MNKNLEFNLKTTNCEISDLDHFKITEQLRNEIEHVPNPSQVNLHISKDDHVWSFDVSMRYGRGYVATHKIETSLDQVICAGLEEFKKDLHIHQIQSKVETFHFDRIGEYDYYTEVSNETITLPKRKLTTLVVEDDPVAALVLKTILKGHGCEVNHYDDPIQALKVIQEKRYDLLVLDWNLPYMKGSEFLTAADSILKMADRPGRQLRQMPVVVCTSLPLEEIKLPAVSHFCFYNHWHKGLPFSSVLGSVDEVTQKIMARNRIAVS